jgi:hypothetical protein
LSYAPTTTELAVNLRKYVHSPNLGRNPEVLAGALFHTQYPGMTANPALLPGSQFGREDEDELYIRAFRHVGLGIKEYAIRAEISSLGAQGRTPCSAPDADR